MWCCKSNAAVEHRHDLAKLAHQQEDANSTAATNNSEDGSDATENVQDTTHANFILHQLSNDKEGSFSETKSTTNYHSRNKDNETSPLVRAVTQKQEQGVMSQKNTSVIVSYDNDDDDDNITTVYSEDTPLPNPMFKRHVSRSTIMANNSLGSSSVLHGNYKDQR
jgi:hypothetical protein